jgi:hypothetical protein
VGPNKDLVLESELKSILQHFQIEGGPLDVLPYGDGHINDTYLVHCQVQNTHINRYILQRINHAVFKHPEIVMDNMVRVTEHIRRKVAAAGGDSSRKTITLIPALDGSSYYISPAREYWRMCRYIDGARTFLHAENQQHYYQAGYAFGNFLTLLSDFQASQLCETIPDFHHTPKRYQAFVQAVESDRVNRINSVKLEIDFILERESEIDILHNLLECGAMPERVTHNDTKIDNVMIDNQTGEGLCVVDLDTVMPGLVVFDFGDAVRSGANLGVEDEPDPRKVAFSLDIFDRLAHGFLDAARGMLTSTEATHLAFGAKLITLEQGIRFLTDYLNGDIYYKTQRSNQNLDRARTQLKLVADMENVFDKMESTIEKYWMDEE